MHKRIRIKDHKLEIKSYGIPASFKSNLVTKVKRLAFDLHTKTKLYKGNHHSNEEDINLSHNQKQSFLHQNQIPKRT